MFNRFRFAVGLAFILALLTLFPVSAKGSFSFIEITGSNLKEAVRLTDPALTADFFAFADFYRNRIEAPDDPGAGYEITRYYVDGNRESAFDKLHYYPDSGYVYYNGIVNGSSEYDGKWYSAESEMKSVFEAALNTQIRLVELGKPEASSAIVPPPSSVDPAAQAQPNTPITKPELLLPIVIAGLMAIMAFAFWRHRSFAH